MIKLSIIIPSYNESLELKKKAIDEIEQFVKQKKFLYEILIVDDKSTNNTLDLIKKYVSHKKHFRVLENEHGGKAITVMNGMLEAKGEIRLFTDMDQATPIKELDKFLSKFDQGYDIVIGTRHGRKGAPVLRKIAAVGFSILRNIFLSLPFADTQCGFKAFRAEAAEKIFPPLLISWKKMKSKEAAVNAGFDVETLFLAKKKGLKISEVDVEWHHVQNEKQVQLVKDSLETIKDMVRIRLNDLNGKYS